MRPIDVDELINNINEFAECVKAGSEFTRGYIAAHKAFAKLLAEQPTIEQPQWISCDVRLPQESGEYIVTACDEGCPYGEGIWYDTVVVWAEYSYEDGCWTWNENGTEYDLSGLVTHWMPLPQPPKGDE